MKPLFFLLFFFSISVSFCQTYSDQYYKDFSAPEQDEIAMSACSFDPDAAAIYLRKDATIIPDGYRMFKYCRNRIKILKSTGLDEANIKIRFYHYGDYEKIENIKAVSINYDKDGTKHMYPLEAKNIYYTKDDQFYTTISFSMPEVREGTIIEYSYISERIAYQLVDYWYFQDDLPVLHSVLDYTILPNAQFAYRVLKPASYPVKMKEVKLEGRLVFEMGSLPAITDEPFMDAKRDYLSRVELQMNHVGTGIDRESFVSSWPELTQQLLKDEEFGMMLSRSIPGTENVVKQAAAISSPKERMSYVFNTVQGQLTWNNYIGIYAKDRLKTVWEKKRGSAAEINLTLINLLNGSGIEALPLLVSDRYHGKVNTSHPFINQFSKVIAYVVIDDQPYFLDATGSGGIIGLIPENLLNTTGYLVSRKNSAFIQIKDPVHFEKRMVNISGKISADGVLDGQAFVVDKDYSRIKKEKEIRLDKNEYISKNFEKPFTQLTVDSFTLRNMDADSLPLEQLVNFHHKLEVSGDYFLLYPNMFSGAEKNPFLAESRSTEINFGYKRSLTINSSFELPEGLGVESLPKPTGLRTADTGMVVSRVTDISPDGKRFIVKIKLDLNRSVYPADEYPGVREFFKKMYGMLNEPVVLTRKR